MLEAHACALFVPRRSGLVPRRLPGLGELWKRRMSEAELAARIEQVHRPYHAALETLAARRHDTVICAIHSFTPRLFGRGDRPWQVGILYSHADPRLGPAMVAACRDQGWITGENQPYDGHLDGDSVDRHALRHGRPNMLIEVRNDLIATPEGQQIWADRLAPVIARVLDASGL